MEAWDQTVFGFFFDRQTGFPECHIVSSAWNCGFAIDLRLCRIEASVVIAVANDIFDCIADIFSVAGIIQMGYRVCGVVILTAHLHLPSGIAERQVIQQLQESHRLINR